MLIIYSAAALAAGFVLDCIFGDPHWRFHPICIIGDLISICERVLRRVFRGHEIAAGIMLVIIVCAVVTAAAAAVSAAAYLVSPWLYVAAESIMCWFILAARSLRCESMKVYDAIKYGSLEDARRAVSMIVGRDTAALDEKGVIRAAVETVAENASDGVIAPMLYFAAGGAPLGFLYKAVNTMDSMVGYKNEKYIKLGRAAARLDDAVNFIPSRLSGLLIVLAAYVAHMDGAGAMRIFRRDRAKHASPNSAQTEAACAGALGVRLAGDAYYFGKLYKKEYIGDERREIEPEDIVRANRLMYAASVMALVILLGLKTALYFILF